MARMKAATRQAARPATCDGETSGAVWGVTGVMAKEILPDGPTERRRRRRLYALRALDRLGLLGEENMIPTLAGRPRLRWLADEGGARWEVLTELGRIGEPGAFEEAVEWTLQTRPRPEQAKAYVCHLRSGAHRTDDARPETCGSVARQTAPSVPRTERSASS
jgi:hypothetical protein